MSIEVATLVVSISGLAIGIIALVKECVGDTYASVSVAYASFPGGHDILTVSNTGKATACCVAVFVDGVHICDHQKVYALDRRRPRDINIAARGEISFKLSHTPSAFYNVVVRYKDGAGDREYSTVVSSSS